MNIMSGNSRRKKASGFTLIELLVVIAIIAILAAILFPVFAQAREKARSIACTSNLKQLALGTLQYVQDYDETFPSGSSLWGPGFGWSGSGSGNWSVAVLPYIKSNGVFGCPDDPDANTIDGPTHNYWWAGLQESYAANGLAWIWSPNGHSCAGLMCIQGYGPPVTDAQVVEPASVISFAEVHSTDLQKAGKGGNDTAQFNNIVNGSGYYIGLNPPNSCGVGGGTACGTAYPTTANGAISVHGDGFSNFSFADGHVKSLLPSATVPGATPSNEFTGSWWNWPEYISSGTGASLWMHNHT